MEAATCSSSAATTPCPPWLSHWRLWEPTTAKLPFLPSVCLYTRPLSIPPPASALCLSLIVSPQGPPFERLMFSQSDQHQGP